MEGRSAMKKIHRFVIWICSKFTRDEIEQIVKLLSDILADRNPEIKPKDDFKEKYPNYRNYFVDALTPIPVSSEHNSKPQLSWKKLIKEYKSQNGKSIEPVKNRKTDTNVPKNIRCGVCGAPSKYLYFNDGKRKTQIKCKVCSSLSQVHPRNRIKTKWLCPHCKHALFLWKRRKDCDIYKCDNDNCLCYLANKAKLNNAEKILALLKPSQFKLRYQYREYHFTNEQLRVSSPKMKILNIRNSLNTMSLVLTFHVSMGLSARKTAFILRDVFSIPISYKTVLNYAEEAAYYCHLFNLKYKGDADSTQAGDETYFKILGKYAYTFFFISEKLRSITAYHVAYDRGTLPATISINEAIRNAKTNNDGNIILVTDGNPSYQSAVHFLNQKLNTNISLKNVIGLQNLDSESEEFRPLKQLIERLNRTYKYHIKMKNGFNSFNGAVTLTVLFVTHYNFLRPHSALKYNVPVSINELKHIDSIQDKWAKIIQMGMELAA
jgi:transposase-like protein